MKKFLIYISIFILVTSTLWGYSNKRIVVDISKQMAYAYEGNRLIYSGWVSTGRKKFKTPTGNFNILKKEKLHISNEWPKPDGGAKMPYMLRLTWSGVALHSGYTPNRPASHGCVRVNKTFAKKLYKWARVGTKVTIKGKLPRRVTRKKGTIFIAYNKNIKTYKNKNIKIAKIKRKKYYSKRNRHNKIALKYSKYSYRQIDRLISKITIKKLQILNSKRLSRYSKIKKLRALKREATILKDAKFIKYKKYKKRADKNIAKNRDKQVIS